MSLRSPLLRALNSAILECVGEDESKTSELITAPVTRRQFLKSSLALAALYALPGTPVAEAHYRSHLKPRIAIVGAGVAGLTASYYLRKLGLASTIYESSTRSGGRIYTAHDLFVHGQWTELGGEFIDTPHRDILHLAYELDILQRIDRLREERGLEEHTFFFGGARRSPAEVLAAFRTVAPHIRKDIDSLPPRISYHAPSAAAISFDNMPLSEYFRSLDCDPWFRELLNVAYLSEYGKETSEQSTLNFLTLINPTSSRHAFAPYGESDERFKIRGGNGRLTDALAKPAQIHHGHTLTSILQVGRSYKLTFDERSRGSKEITADIAIIAIPFTTLRKVEIGVQLPPLKKRAIAELGYGTPSKLILGVTSRPWRTTHSSGYAISETPFQSGWDSAEGQVGKAGTYTIFLGGYAGKDLKGSPTELAANYLPGLAQVYPGMDTAYSGKAVMFNWAEHPHTLGGYAAYEPGQWTTFGGIEGEPVGHLYFAGEHCSAEFQGFMNGGVQTGKRVAEGIFARING